MMVFRQVLALILCVAVVILGIVKKKGGLNGEIKRLARGQLAPQKSANPAQLNRALQRLTTSAVQEGSLLGINRHTRLPVCLSDAEANLHTLAIGTTGSGKTTTVCNVIESAISRKLPVIYVDGKGDLELARRIQAFAEQQHSRFYLFSMVGESVPYNPLASGGITSKKDRLIELRTWSEDHYRKIAEGYLQTVFALLTAFDQPIDLITLANYLTPEALYALAREKKDRQWIPKIEALEEKQKHIGSLIAEIENIAQSEIGHLFDGRQGSVLTLSNALQENAVVYFCLQPLAFPAYAESLGKLIINDLKALAAAQLEHKIKKKLFVILDEFSVFAGEPVIHLINQGRSAGIQAILSTQSLSDIARKGSEALVGQIVSNCNNFIIHRQNYHPDAEQLAQIIGTWDRFEVTSQVDSRRGSTGLGSVRQTKEFIIHPDEIKRLARGEGIVVNKQQFQVQRVHFRKSWITADESLK